MARGISAKSLASISDGDASLGAPAFIYHKRVNVAADTDIEIVSKSEFPFRVIDCWAVANTNMANDDTVSILDFTVDSAGDPDPQVIVTAFAVGGGGDTTADIFRAAEIDDAYHDIGRGGGIQIRANKTSTDIDCEVYVLCVRT
jgi:hypothetical protein